MKTVCCPSDQDGLTAGKFKSPCVQVKELYSNSEWLLVRLHPATPSVQCSSVCLFIFTYFSDIVAYFNNVNESMLLFVFILYSKTYEQYNIHIILQVLEDVCQKQKFLPPEEYKLV